jgi:hypothetical protein
MLIRTFFYTDTSVWSAKIQERGGFKRVAFIFFLIFIKMYKWIVYVLLNEAILSEI